MSSVQPSFYFDQPTNTVDALRRSIANRLVYAIGKDVRAATSRDWLFAILYAVRDRIMDSWRESVNTAQEQDAKRVYYLSMEFLTGRMLTNALMAIWCWRSVAAWRCSRPRRGAGNKKPAARSVKATACRRPVPR